MNCIIPSIISTGMARRVAYVVITVSLLSATPRVGFADAITDWNIAFENSLAAGAERGPRVPIRTLAIMHAAMFDAANGIAQKYKPLHVTESAPPGANAEAAAIQAAYAVLSALRPANQTSFDAQLAISLAQVPGSAGRSQSIARGRQYGAAVAEAILEWRANDGSTTVLPPFVGSTDPGYWRHTPNETSPTAGYANLATVPFLLTDPLAFDPGPPYGFANRADALASVAYAADVNEVQARGGVTSVVRTEEEKSEALFNDACDVADLNRLVRSLLNPKAGLLENARLFALFNMTAFDTTIFMFQVKYVHAFWRPFQAINFADEDNNAATEQDALWTSLLPTPPHPEYVSAHVTLFTALLTVAERFLGEAGPIELATTNTGEARAYESLRAISDATVDARVTVGYHFRQTSLISQVVGEEIGHHVVDHSLTPLHHDHRHHDHRQRGHRHHGHRHHGHRHHGH